MKFVLASKNEGKLREIKSMLSKYNLEVCLESDIGVDIEVEETGDTFEDNSMLKASAVMKATGIPSIADDSGLCIDALGGQPGVYSARFGGETTDYNTKCNTILSMMADAKDRSAHFECVISCYFPNGDIIVAHGECHGKIAHKPAGYNGFAYDMIFIPDGYDKTFAELEAEEKNKISHRGKAIKDFEDKLREYRKLGR